MQKIKVANAHYLSAVPFRMLQDISWVSYEENSAAENSRRLAEHEVDVALIPVSEYARHGGYVGLDFGIACESESNCIFLYSNEAIDQLETIYLYEGAGTSALLLSLLLRDHWKINPRLVRRSSTFANLALEPKEGVLARHETHEEISTRFCCSEDLVRVWYEITKKHFVFMVWALRAGVLNSKTYTEFNGVFHKCSKAKTSLAGEHASSFDVSAQVSSHFVATNNEYYLDGELVSGLNVFFERASNANLIPKTRYRSATRALLNHPQKYRISVGTNTAEILCNSLDGRRLGVEQAHLLVTQGNLADLAMAAELRKDKVPSPSSVARVIVLKEEEILHNVPISFENTKALAVRMVPEKHLADISHYEKILRALRGMGFVQIEGFALEDLTKIAMMSGISLIDVAQRLLAAGLKRVRASTGSIWLDQSFRRKGMHAVKSTELTKILHAVHAQGLESICFLPLRSDDSWEERLVHLSRLRILEDENPGIAYVLLDSSDVLLGGPGAFELRLRALAIARLFLDNIPLVIECSNDGNFSQEALGLSFGASQIRLESSAYGRDAIGDESIAKVLAGIGKTGDHSNVFYT